MDQRWDKSKAPRGLFTLNRDCPQAQGLVAWYPIGNLSSTDFVPDLVNRFHLAGSGGPSRRLGQDNQGVGFYDDAASQFLSGGASVTAMPLTLSAWFNSDDASLVGTPICLGSATSITTGWYRLVTVGSASPKQLRANAAAASASQSQSTITAWAANNWYHGVGVFTSTTSRTIYMNAVAGTTDTTNIAAASAIDTTYIGKYPIVAGPQYWSGALGECGLWNIALDAPTIQRLYDRSTRYELWYPLRSPKWIAFAPAAGAITGPLIKFKHLGGGGALIGGRLAR